MFYVIDSGSFGLFLAKNGQEMGKCLAETYELGCLVPSTVTAFPDEEALRQEFGSFRLFLPCGMGGNELPMHLAVGS